MREFIHQNRFLLAFVILTSFMGISVGLARVTTSLYALALHSSDTMLGLIAGSQSIGILIMSLPIGVLVDHFGPSRLFLAGTLLAGLTYLFIPLSPTPEFLLVCSMLISFFMPLRFVSLNTVFMEQLSKLGEGKAGWFRGTHMVGFFLLGPLLAPIVIGEFNFSGTYWLIAAAFGLTLLAAPVVFSHYTEHRGHGRRFLWADVIGQLGLLRSDLALREVCLIEFFAQSVNGFYSFFIIVIAIQSFHLGADDAARLAAAQGLSLIFALFFFGELARRFGQRTAYLGSFAWIAAALALLGLTPVMQGLWVGGLALGLGVGVLEIVNLTRFARISAVLGRGKIAGINALVGPGGALFGSLLGGMAGPVMGLQAVFLLFLPPLLLFGGRLLLQGVAGAKNPQPSFKWRENPGQTLWHLLEWLAIASLSVSLLLGSGMLLRPVVATPSGLAILLFLTAWSLLVGWLPWTRGKAKPSVALAALLASTVWIAPPLVQTLGVQPSAGHWFDAILGLIREI
jgi:MFS family permease